MESPSGYSPSQLHEKYQLLLSQLKAGIGDCASPDEVFAAAGIAIHDLLSLHASQYEEIVDLRFDLESHDGYTRGLRETHKALQADFQDTLCELKATKADLETAESKLQVAEAQLQRLQAKEEEASDEWAVVTLGKETKLRMSLEQEVEKLGAEIKQLKEDKFQKEPLVKIGIDVRLRFLEQAREYTTVTISKKKIQMDRDILMLGDRAAHGGCGEADGSLFVLGVVPTGSFNTLTTVYKKLYHTDPIKFKLDSPQLREVVNHKVTIRTLRAINFGPDRPILERQRAMEHIDIVMIKCAKLNDSVLVAADTDITRRVALIREETVKIVELDRQTRSQPQSQKENRKPGKSERVASSGFGLC